ncbi:uncharacterized protein LOC136095105 [Hydra vulgaris]|uniref:uncharacterized protein LOC136095105 n=1 Tax=Hydra vulgaris TaxID=6087 RepID=UPI0032EA007F
MRVELKLVKENNISKFFNYVNRKLNNSKSIFPLKDINNNNKITCSNEEIADVFNNHFGSVFTNDNNFSPFINSYVDDLIGIETVLFPPEAVYKSLKEIKTSTSYGPDGIPNILLKKLAHLLCIPLSFIFDASFKSISLPKQWRQAFVFPVFKKGATADPNNNRPISLTSTCSRVMKRMINVYIIKYLGHHNLISLNQNGFLNKRSTSTNLLESANDWNTALDNHQITDVVYIDFRKAFDSVLHTKLLVKLASYNIKDDIKLYSSYRDMDLSEDLVVALNRLLQWMPKKCCAYGCKTNYQSTKNNKNFEKIPVYRFLKDKEQRNIWIKSIPNSNLLVSDETVISNNF